MSNKKLFWIAFFGLTLVEAGQMAYSNDHKQTIISDSEITTGLCYQPTDSRVLTEYTTVYGQPRLMLI